MNPSHVIATASTGIAALLLVGGSTVHRSFCVPNDVDVDTDPMISPESKKGEFIKNAKLIIIDVCIFFIFIVFKNFFNFRK